jgi:hypothetical protein
VRTAEWVRIFSVCPPIPSESSTSDGLPFTNVPLVTYAFGNWTFDFATGSSVPLTHDAPQLKRSGAIGQCVDVFHAGGQASSNV